MGLDIESIMRVTVAKHLVICELSVFGKQDTKFEVDRTLKNSWLVLK